MYGKHSLTAAVVAIGGPNGPRYYPEAFSPDSAEAFADSSRAAGIPAVVVPVDLRMPDPGELLKMPRPQLWGVAKTHPFDVVADDVQRGREAAGDEPRGSSDVSEPTASEAADANDRLERSHDTIGRLALLEYSVEQSKDGEQRLQIFREMHSLAVPLVKHLYPLTEDTDEDNVFTRLADEMHESEQAEGEDAEPEDEPREPEEGDGFVRAVAARFLDEEAGTGRWYRKLVDPTWDIGPEVSRWATGGRSVRLYDVAIDLDRGNVTVRPQPGWKSGSDQGTVECCEESADAPAGDEEDDSEDDPERLGDESTYIGGASFERLPDQWTVWLMWVEHADAPQLTAAFPTLDEAWAEAEKWRDDPENPNWAAVIVGPGEGPVSVDNITIWPHKWTVRDAEGGGGIGLDGYPEDSRHAKFLAVTRTDACPVITAAYRPESKGGVR